MNKLSGYSDEKLLALIANDDEKAFEILFDRYWETAHCLTYSKVRSKEATREIVLDLFLNFWQRRHSLEIENFSNYLRIAIKYKAITFYKQQISRKRSFEEYVQQLTPQTEATSRSMEFNELVKALEEGVKELPEKTQEVFRLSRVEGHSVAEIAKRLNLSEKAIEYHITRSRKELRLYLKDFLAFLLIALLV